MSVSEVLFRARESLRRLQEIEQFKELSLSHVGVQGHQFAHVSCGSTLDPSRKIVDVLDTFEGLDTEIAACTADIADADAVLEGVRRSFSDGGIVADVLDQHIHGCNVAEITTVVSVDESTVRRILDRGIDVLDGIGVARLRSVAT